MRLIWGAVAAALLASVSAHAQTTQADRDRAKALVQQGMALIQQGQLRPALGPLFDAARADPMNADAHSQAAGVLADLGEDTQSAHQIDYALSIDVHHEGAWWVVGMTALKRNSFATAAEAFRKVVEVDPKAAGAWSNRGHALAQLGRYQESLAAFQKAEALSPGMAKDNIAVVQGWIAQGKRGREPVFTPYGNARVQKLLADAAKEKPDPKYVNKRKQSTRDSLSGKTGGAYIVDLAEGGVTFGINDAEAWTLLGRALDFQGIRSEEAIYGADAHAAYSQAIALNPGDTEAHLWRGKIRLGWGDFDGAIADFQAAGGDPAAQAGLAAANAGKARWGRSFDAFATNSLAASVRSERQGDVILSLERGAFPDVPVNVDPSEGAGIFQPLWWMTMRTDDLGAEALLNAGASTDYVAPDGTNVTTQATSRGLKDLLAALLKKGTGAKGKNWDGDTALMAAIKRHDVGLARTLLAGDRSTINTPDKDGLTPVGYCATQCSAPMLAALLGAGGDAKGGDKWGSWTKQAGNYGLLANYALLLRAGAEPAEPYPDQVKALKALVDGAPNGPAAKMVAAVTTGDKAAAKRAVDAAAFTPDQATAAVMTTMELDDPAILEALAAKGANVKTSMSGAIALGKLAYDRQAYSVSHWLDQHGAGAPPVDLFADKAAEFVRKIETAEMEASNYYLSVQVDENMRDPRRLEICRALNRAVTAINYAIDLYYRIPAGREGVPYDRLQIAIDHTASGSSNFQCNVTGWDPRIKDRVE